MRRIIAIVVLIFFLLNCASTLPRYEYRVYEREQPVVISERVGDTVDPEESEHFDLFRGIEEFEGAQFYALEDGGYVVEIAAKGEKLAAINRDQDAIAILRDYIDRYEEINTDRPAFMRKWNILDYDTLGVPITAYEVTNSMEQSRSRARRTGCTGCVGVSLFGLLIGLGFAGSGAGSQTPGPAIGAAAGAIALGIIALIGLVAMGTVIAVTYSRDEADFLEMIKEARKPQPHGVRASARIPGD
jgi:hypothetical protein